MWAILGAQSQARSSILGTGKAFDVEDVINSEVDLPRSIERYQLVLQYARSKVDFGSGLYIMPSDMDLYIGTINGYNNLITIATDDLQLGFNDDINEEQQIQQYQFESPKDDFELVPDDPALQLQQEESINKEELQQEEYINKEELQQEAIQAESINKEELQQEAIQEESMNKGQRRKKSLHTKRINYFLRFLV